MAVTITASDVKNDYATGISDSEIALLINFVSGADTCLDANSVPANTQTILKIYAVRHLLELQENDGRGKAVSETAPNGAGRSFAKNPGTGLMSTNYGKMIRQMDVAGCVSGLMENGARLQLRSVGRRDPDSTRPTYG